MDLAVCVLSRVSFYCHCDWLTVQVCHCRTLACQGDDANVCLRFVCLRDVRRRRRLFSTGGYYNERHLSTLETDCTKKRTRRCWCFKSCAHVNLDTIALLCFWWYKRKAAGVTQTMRNYTVAAPKKHSSQSMYSHKSKADVQLHDSLNVAAVNKSSSASSKA